MPRRASSPGPYKQEIPEQECPDGICGKITNAVTNAGVRASQHIGNAAHSMGTRFGETAHSMGTRFGTGFGTAAQSIGTSVLKHLRSPSPQPPQPEEPEPITDVEEKTLLSDIAGHCYRTDDKLWIGEDLSGGRMALKQQWNPHFTKYKFFAVFGLTENSSDTKKYDWLKPWITRFDYDSFIRCLTAAATTDTWMYMQHGRVHDRIINTIYRAIKIAEYKQEELIKRRGWQSSYIPDDLKQGDMSSAEVRFYSTLRGDPLEKVIDAEIKASIDAKHQDQHNRRFLTAPWYIQKLKQKFNDAFNGMNAESGKQKTDGGKSRRYKQSKQSKRSKRSRKHSRKTRRH